MAPRPASLLVLSWLFVFADSLSPPSLLLHSAGCPSLPCVLPVNANITLSDYGAGVSSTASISLDLYPGPLCDYDGTSSSFFNKWVCGTGSENPTHNDGSYFNMVRILFPPGFDTQQATLTNETVDITSAMYYPKIRSYQLFDVNGTEYTVNETYYVPTFYQSFGQVSMLKKTPQPSGYGIREPYPQDFPEYIDGVLAESRVGSTRGSRDPASGFDPRRVVDFVLAEIPWDLKSISNSSVKRVQFKVDGIRNAPSFGPLGSSAALNQPVFGVQIYKALLQVQKTNVTNPDDLLMRFYNNHINDPCIAGKEPSVGTCPAAVHQANFSMNWFQATSTTEAVLLCPPGFKSLSTSPLICEPCAPGSYSNMTMSTSCILCAAGERSVATSRIIEPGGATVCEACDAGFYSRVGSSECQGCSAGFFSPMAASACNPCPIGYFSGPQATSCSSCPANQTTFHPGSSACIFICLPGQYRSNESVCQVCQPGTYSDVPNAVECRTCSPGYYNDVPASIHCFPCLPGSYLGSEGGTACEICPFHTYSDVAASSACTLCPHDPQTINQTLFYNASEIYFQDISGTDLNGWTRPIMRTLVQGATSASFCHHNCVPGTFSLSKGLDTSSSPCELCGLGHSNNLYAATSCTICAKGTISNRTGAISCDECREGEYVDVEGSVYCYLCSAGEMSTASKEACYICQNGTHSLSSGSTTCSTCGDGEFSGRSESACSTCPHGKTTLGYLGRGEQDCQDFSRFGLVGWWKFEWAAIEYQSSYSRAARNEMSCREARSLLVSPSRVRDQLGSSGFEFAELRGPVCIEGSEWEVSGMRAMGLHTFQGNNGALESLYFDGVNNPGLVVGAIETLLTDAKLPQFAMSIETWVVMNVKDSNQVHGLANAMEQGANYEKGWSLGYWLDAKDRSRLFLYFEISVEANNEQSNDFNQYMYPGLSRDRGKFSRIVRIIENFSWDKWYHIVASYDNETISLFVDGQLLGRQPVCPSPPCGSILYPRTQDYWSSKLPAFFNIGGAYNSQENGSYFSHKGLMSSFRVYNVSLSDELVRNLFDSHRSRYQESIQLKSYWVRVNQTAGDSPSVDLANSNVNSPGYIAARGSQVAYVVLRGRFLLSEKYSCRWSLGTTFAESKSSDVINDRGEVVESSQAQVADALRCALPEWRYGQTSEAGLSVKTSAGRSVWQLPCSDVACGYSLPGARSKMQLTSWWETAGMGSLSGEPVKFEFLFSSCPAGFFSFASNSLVQCLPCPAGRYSKLEGSAACLPCQEGTYQNELGQSVCKTCPNGKYTSNIGSTTSEQCSDFCAIGTYEQNRVQPCRPCAQGTFADEVGLTACKVCPPGTSSRPPGGSSVGASGCSPLCPPGQFGAFGIEPCSLCVNGSIASSSGSTVCSECSAGFYPIADASFCVECPSLCQFALLVKDPQGPEIISRCCR